MEGIRQGSRWTSRGDQDKGWARADNLAMKITHVSDPDQTSTTADVLGEAMPRLRRRALGWVMPALLALWAAAPVPSPAQDRPQKLPTITVTAGMHMISAEVAQTAEQRAIGLMHRREMPQHAGMLFVFDQPSAQCFWMKNTLLPLSIAFLEDDGTIVNVEEMKPLALDSHCSAKPVRLALEMNAGWFAKRGLGPGAKLGSSVFRSRTP